MLLERLSQRDVLEQSCQQIRRELCRCILTKNGLKFREPSCIFETHTLHYRGEEYEEPDGVGEDQIIDCKDIPPIDPNPSDRAQATKVHSLSTSVDETIPTHLPTNQASLNGTKMKNLGPNYLSLVVRIPSYTISTESLTMSVQMPIMVTMWSQAELGVDRALRKQKSDELSKDLLFCRSSKEDRIGICGSLTLDEYSYPALPETILDRRNDDQTLIRLGKKSLHPYVARGAGSLVMVDQIWVWQAQDALIFARLEEDYVLRYPIVSRTNALLTSYGQVGVFLADALDSTESDSILDQFQTAIVKLAEEVAEYSKQTGVDSIGINEEKEFFHEINDIREELSMIQRVLSQQEEVWRDFTSNAWPEFCTDPMGGRSNYQITGTQSDSEKQDQKEIMQLIGRPRILIQKRQRRIAQLDEDAERVERSIGIQLDLKKQHTSLQEAHATAIISAAAFGFAVITIIFTPLSFAMSLFALPIDRFQESQIPSRWTSEAGMYSTKYIGTWAGKVLTYHLWKNSD